MKAIVLYCIVISGHFHLVRMLINEYEADIHVPSLLAKQTPLHLAVGKGLRQIASILLTHGADLHATDSKGCWYECTLFSVYMK